MLKLAFCFCALLALAAAVANDRVLMGTAQDCAFRGSCVGHDWKPDLRLVADVEVPLIFALKSQTSLDQCSQMLLKVSTPSSPAYGSHLSFEEIGRLFGNKEGAESVRDWLQANGVPPTAIEINPNYDYVSARVSHAVAEVLFASKFQPFFSGTVGKRIARAKEYSLPLDIASVVQHVANVVSFPLTLTRTPVRALTATSGSTEISLLNSFYNITSNEATNPKSTQSLFESLGQSYSEKDLSAFQQKYGITRKKISKVIGPNDPSQCTSSPDNCAEANLDVQYIMAVARNVSTTYWSVPGDVEPFVDWAKAVSAATNPPLVHSISYGSVEQQNDPNEVKSFNTEVCKLGLRGLTVLISSGDDGVANYVARQDSSQCGFNPSYPASCPFSTAVGATQGPEDGKEEIACTSDAGGLITTGGGFSTIFDRPDWQKTAVDAYINSQGSTLPPKDKFNANGRAYPDIAVMGHNYVVNIGGKFYQVSGTSASAPVFAGMIALVNDARLNAGKAPLGFLNPTLYSLQASVFKDVSKGKNNCCAGNPGSQVCCSLGFSAAAGWDPLTGLGTVNFGKFKDALVALP